MAKKNIYVASSRFQEEPATKTSAKDRYNEAKEMAGATAANKASLANKQAKQAAAMSNNSKVMQAMLGAQAASDAISQGYDEGLDRGANMASQVASEEAREKEREQNQRQFEAQLAQQAAESEKQRKFQKSENKKDRKQGLVNTAIGAALKGFGW